jgi:hypothetical protein
MSKLRQIAVVLAITAGIVSFVHYGPPKFWHDFKGMSEATVREKLGQPFYDNRVEKAGEVAEYTLGWHQGFEIGLFLTFRDGIVVSQKRVSR